MSSSQAMPERLPLIAGNWKMHKTSAEGAAFIQELAMALGRVDGREVLVAPPFTGLAEAVKAAEGSPIKVVAQDVFWESEGAYTGEVSTGMLSALGVEGAIVGHSERRGHFGETDDDVAKKVGALMEAGMLAIMCVGEREDEREGDLTERVLARQVPAGLALASAEHAERLSIAYEPIWAIGTGKTATPKVAQDAIAFVRRQVAEALGAEAAARVRVLYGGSVTPDNVDELMAEPDIDGALVGGASLKTESFARIVAYQKPSGS